MVTVTGHVIAISELLVVESKEVRFVELREEDEEESEFIEISSDLDQQVSGLFQVGHLYTVTYLLRKRRKPEEVIGPDVLLITSESNIQHHSDVPPLEPPEPEEGIVACIEAQVTSVVCAPLGLYSLDNGCQLCIGVMFSHSRVSRPKVGAYLRLHNVHRIDDNPARMDADPDRMDVDPDRIDDANQIDDDPDRIDDDPEWIGDDPVLLIMCGRSRLEVMDGELEDGPVPGLMNSVEWSWNSGRVRWFHSQLRVMERKVSGIFVEAHNLGRYCDASRVQQLLVANMVQARIGNVKAPVRHIKQEFTSVPHQCSTARKKYDVSDVPLLEQMSCEHKTRQAWAYHYKPYSMVVALLSADQRTGYWKVQDATDTLPCLLTGDISGVQHLHGKMVLIRRCRIVLEVTQSQNELVYVHAETKHVEGLIKEKKAHGGPDLYNRLLASRDPIQHCDLLNQTVELRRDQCLFFLVYNKSTSDSVQSFLWVSIFLEDFSRRKKCCLKLTEKHLQLLPLIQRDRYYILALPNPQSIAYYLDCDSHPRREVLVQDCKVCFLGHPVPGLPNPVPKTIYRVGDPNLNSSQQNLSVRGAIAQRFSQNARIGDAGESRQGFGIPGNENISLLLFNPCANSTQTITLYLNEWRSRAYPLGLVPGAHVLVHNVNCAISQKKNAYLSSNKETCIRVDAMPGAVVMNVPLDLENQHVEWREHCIITEQATIERQDTVLCGIPNRMKIESLKVSALCKCCAALCCSSHPLQFYTIASARMIMHDEKGSAEVFVKNKQLCTLLGMPENMWSAIMSDINRNVGQVNLLFRQVIPEPESGLSTEEEGQESDEEESNGQSFPAQMLRFSVESFNMSHGIFEILCRPMKGYIVSNDQHLKLFCLGVRRPVSSST